MKNVILTDVDGVLLNWEHSFDIWMNSRGYKKIQNASEFYDTHIRYGISKEEKNVLVKNFNESANIGFLPPLRDAVYYVRKLHEKHGFVFHVITSLSLNPFAQQLRTENLKRVFGQSIFEKFVYLDTGADKDDALLPYKNSELFWIEDKVENARTGFNLGLQSVLMEHPHNSSCKDFIKVKNWKEFYNNVT